MQTNPHQARIAQIEEFINDVLKEDLRQLDQCLQQFNEEIMEYVQLKNTLETFQSNMKDGYKTQVNIGSNMFMQAKVKSDQMDKIMVNIGKDIYLSMSMKEAQQFSDVRVKILTKQADIVREESVKKRAQIKMALLAISEREKLLMDEQEEARRA
ncbi:uncharacterized protein Dwil_GK18126 [Drosophila willistoni]|uniref:Uncharacterized protein n=1 Tax=Drosophila willistoni TaxID=7260 RepID=B4MZ94_DROWI|nr:protein UXT [Drosophila willistoni]EDW77367.1 uncharacterized protein Dwil_GK18126 [Drosophila willistoni]